MMSIEQNPIIDDGVVKRKCKICSGKGIIQIYRSDLEEFEEIKCPHVKRH